MSITRKDELITVNSGSLTCPYSSCGQQFEQPVLVTDYSKLPRETHYACPHCMLRLELHLDGKGRDGLGHVQVKAVNEEEALISKLECEEETRKLGEGVSSVQASRPSKSCRHFLGYLRSIPEGASMPDECAVCPNILQCYMKRE